MAQANRSEEMLYSLARVRGRSIGSMVFAVFGALWLAMSAYAFGYLTSAVKCLLAAGGLASIGLATMLLRAAPAKAANDPQERRDGRRFAWVNAGQGVAIFLAIQVANNLHRPNAAFPAMALIVGLHFFLLPRSMRHRSTWITGAVMTLAALLCPLLLHGNTMVGAVTLCAGVTLWSSSAWALLTAVQRYRGLRNAADLKLPAHKRDNRATLYPRAALD